MVAGAAPGRPDAHRAGCASDLAFAELQLSAYRTALHARFGAATHELIARYREDPSLALPLPPRRVPIPRAGTR